MSIDRSNIKEENSFFFHFNIIGLYVFFCFLMVHTIYSGGLISFKIIAFAILSGAIYKKDNKNEKLYFSHF